MYQYKNFRIVESESGYYVFSPKGKKFGPFSTDTEAEEFIDNITE